MLILDNARGHPQSLQGFYPWFTAVSTCKYDMWYSAYGSGSISHLQDILHQQNSQWGSLGNEQEIWTSCEQILDRLHLDEVNNTEDTWADIKEPAPDAVTSVVHTLNQLNLEISTKDEDELSASHSEPTSNKDLTDMQEANQVPSEAHHSYQSPSTRLWQLRQWIMLLPTLNHYKTSWKNTIQMMTKVHNSWSCWQKYCLL